MELHATKIEQPSSKGLFVKSKCKPNQSKGGKQQSNEEHKPKTKLRCNYCKKKSHLMRDCYNVKRKNQEKEKDAKGKQPEASIVEGFYFYSNALTSTRDKANQVSLLGKHDWVLDSGCTNHMTPFKSWFNTYKEVDGELVYMGNNESCKIQGIGSVSLRLKEGTVKLLRNVRHVPMLEEFYFLRYVRLHGV